MPQGTKNGPKVTRSVEFEFERDLRELEVELVLKVEFELERELELELRLKPRTPLAGNCRHAAAACDAATLLSLPVDDCGHDDGGLCSEAWGRFEARGPLVYIAGLVGSHTPWAHKRKELLRDARHALQLQAKDPRVARQLKFEFERDLR